MRAQLMKILQGESSADPGKHDSRGAEEAQSCVPPGQDEEKED